MFLRKGCKKKLDLQPLCGPRKGHQNWRRAPRRLAYFTLQGRTVENDFLCNDIVFLGNLGARLKGYDHGGRNPEALREALSRRKVSMGERERVGGSAGTIFLVFSWTSFLNDEV